MDVLSPKGSEGKLSSSDSNQRTGIDFSVDPNLPSTSNTRKKSVCWFFSTYGTCKFGANCFYSHVKPRRQTSNKPTRKKSGEKSGVSNIEYKAKSPLNVPSRSVVCRFFKASDCRTANHLDFGEIANIDLSSQTLSFCYDDVDRDNEMLFDCVCTSENISEKSEAPTISVPNAIIPPQAGFSHQGDNLDLRKTEIQLFKKRYPEHKHVSENETDIFETMFSSSDPDWAFYVKFVQLEIHLPSSYPKEICDIKVLDRKEEMPPFLLRFLNQSIKHWLLERHKSNVNCGKSELVLRPFFKWLDRNLENLFIEGLRKVKMHVEAENAGFEFVPYEQLPGATNIVTEQGNSKDTTSKEMEENNNIADSLCELSISNSKHEDSNANIYNTEEEETATLNPNSCVQKEDNGENYRTNMKHGTEIKLVGLELTEGTASFECQKISVSVNCIRCKTPRAFLISPKQCQSASCAKCHKSLQVTFQPSLIHQHSNVLGYLHLFDCQVVDMPLPQCHFFIDCLNCNKRNSFDGIHYGQMLTTWCLFCNQKLCLTVQACKFQRLQPSLKTGKPSVVHSEKKPSKSKDIVIELGKPLPKIGTCSHYKKSHRWLRFPCCGKLYPCDICHNEAETGHEMKFASRMVCGFCSKEQPYSADRPCVSCSASLTKKSGKHWEGGKGCRDKIRMSRDDKHKYAGVSKTISKKSTDQKTKKKV